MPPPPALTAVSQYELGRATIDRDIAPATAAHSFGPIRPDRLTVRPSADGSFAIDVRWHGRERVLRAVVVRRLLSEAGYPATAGNSIDGRTWQVGASSVPADEVAEVIETLIC